MKKMIREPIFFQKYELKMFSILLFLIIILSSCDKSNIDSSSNSSNQVISNNYTVTFKDYDGSVLETTSVREGDTASYSKEVPTRSDDDNYSYFFSGWNPSLGVVNSDMTYVAEYTKTELVSCSVTFDANGGTFGSSVIDITSVRKNKTITAPTSPSRKNYSFAGWTTTKDGSIMWNFSYDVVEKDMTLYAKWQQQEAVVLSVESAIINNDSIYLVVDNDIEYVSLSNKVIVSDNSSWKLYRDRLGQTEIPTKMAGTLVNGDNIFYIVVSNLTGTQTNTYEFNIHRSHIVSIKFMDTDLSIIKTVNVASGIEYSIDYVYEEEGYTFNGWSLNDNEITTVMPRTSIELNIIKTPNTYKVTLDVNGGNSLNKTEYDVLYNNYINLPIPEREGYTFLGWEYNDSLLTNENGYGLYSYSRNVDAKAKWQINQYSIALNVNNEKAGTVSGTGIYNYDNSISIMAISNPGYTFIGWYDGDNELIKDTVYTFKMPAKNLSYTAKWKANTNTPYKVEHYLQNIDNNNYPDTPEYIDNLTGTTDTLTNGKVNTYEGFTSPTITQVNIKGDGTTVIELYYTRNSYTVTLNKDINSAGYIYGNGSYKYGKKIIIRATTNLGYTFTGWYKNGANYTKESSFEFTIGATNEFFEAQYTINKYIITLDNQAEGIIITGITSGSDYEFASLITLSATNIPLNQTIKWSRSDGITYVKDSYSFNVPSSNVIITISTIEESNSKNGKIYLGTYPQTKVNDDSLIEELNNMSGDLPTLSNKYNWFDYNYYISSTLTSYMFYQDIDYDNDGTFDYRGVYFTEYRPSNNSNKSSESTSYQDNNGYLVNNIYWFRFEPIEWDILTESDGKALVIANLILDNQNYYPSLSTSIFSHNGGQGYANNYELSNIRKWLNDNFYNTAFGSLEQKLIETITVDNSAYSTAYSSNNYACKNTQDKIFLLSFEEANLYYSTSDDRKTSGTDYVKCQGLFVYDIDDIYFGNSSWLLRSPITLYSNGVNCVSYATVDISYGRADHTFGIRPACWVYL